LNPVDREAEEDFRQVYFEKCAELKLPPHLEIMNLIRQKASTPTSSGTINLDNLQLTDEDIAPLICSLEKCKTTKNLILSHNQIKVFFS